MQTDEFLQKIKETNGHASRNILNLRNKLMTGKTTPTAKATAKSANTQQDDSRADVPTQSTNRTKKELLEDQTGSLSTMAGELTTSNQIMSDWIDEKRKTTALNRLRQLRADDIISDDEYKAKARDLIQSEFLVTLLLK